MRDWWNNVTLEQFETRTKCIEDQYSKYFISAQNVSGTLTLGENIADNGGLKTAYYAYKSWLSEHGSMPELPLPGLNHTHDQLFFLSFAQVSWQHWFFHFETLFWWIMCSNFCEKDRKWESWIQFWVPLCFNFRFGRTAAVNFSTTCFCTMF